jgi:hypothetical protein
VKLLTQLSELLLNRQQGTLLPAFLEHVAMFQLDQAASVRRS